MGCSFAVGHASGYATDSSFTCRASAVPKASMPIRLVGASSWCIPRGVSGSPLAMWLEQWLHERVVVQTCSLWQGHQSVPTRCSWQAASVRISVKSTACLAMPTVSAGAWKRWRQAENSWPKPRTDALLCRSHRQWSWGNSGAPKGQPDPAARGAQDARRHRGFSTSPASCKVGYCMVRPVRCGSLN